MRGRFANPPGSAASRSALKPAQIRSQPSAQAILEADHSIEQESPQPGRGISPQRSRQNLAEPCAILRRDFSAFDSEDGPGTRRLAKHLGGNSRGAREKGRNRSEETQAKPPDRTAAGIPAG